MISNIKDAEQSSHMAKCPKCGHVFDITFTCNRCNHTWIPRENEEPSVCPKCKSPYWNKERVRAINVKNTKGKK